MIIQRSCATTGRVVTIMANTVSRHEMGEIDGPEARRVLAAIATEVILHKAKEWWDAS
jgi:hypothetical protein